LARPASDPGSSCRTLRRKTAARQVIGAAGLLMRSQARRFASHHFRGGTWRFPEGGHHGSRMDIAGAHMMSFRNGSPQLFF